jgi:hypothetical protein
MTSLGFFSKLNLIFYTTQLTLNNYFFNIFVKKFIAMAKRKYTEDDENDSFQSKQYKEGELILLFNLTRIVEEQTLLMQEWLTVENPIFNVVEQYIFDKKYKEAVNNISGWSEEDLKVKFLSAVIELGHLEGGNGIVTFFDKMISAKVESTFLSVKADFMMAKGLLDVFSTPYFHFQEYKPYKKPSGDSMAQLLEAFLIAQVKNKDTQTPLYGVEIIGGTCRFVIMEGKQYCISKPYALIDKEDLLQIIAILRKFRWILETRLMKNE